MIKEFFIDETIGASFNLFGLIHFMAVSLTVVIAMLMHIYRKKLTSLPKNAKRKIALTLITIMFLNMTIYYVSLIYYGVYDLRVHLPLHFCFISGYLFMYAIAFNKVDLYKKIYFWAFIGPIPAILLPDLQSSFDSFLFYQQIISHHFFLLSSLFIFYAYDINITVKDIKDSITMALILFGFMYIFNTVFKTNYIMQNKLPTHVLKTFPFIGNLSYPVLALLPTGFTMVTIAYLPIYLKNIKEVKK